MGAVMLLGCGRLALGEAVGAIIARHVDASAILAEMEKSLGEADLIIAHAVEILQNRSLKIG